MGTRRLAAIVALVQVAGVSAAARHEPGPPRGWDRQLRPLVAFVEGERGREFRHPVDVDALDDAAFAAALGHGRPDPYELAEARALGLATHADHAPARASPSRSVGVYLPSLERIIVRGVELTPYSQATVVHELTHALDDQHFDLQALGGRRPASYSERVAQRSVIEASASIVEDAFVASLGAASRAAYDAELASRRDAGLRAGAPALPAATAEIFRTPYEEGPRLVRSVAGDRYGGDLRRAVDELLTDPPDSDADVLWPGREGPRRARGDFGAARLRAVVAQHTGDRGLADSVGRAWAGDEMHRYRESPSATCVRVDVDVVRSARSATAIALGRVAAGLHRGELRLRADGMPSLVACDGAAPQSTAVTRTANTTPVAMIAVSTRIARTT